MPFRDNPSDVSIRERIWISSAPIVSPPSIFRMPDALFRPGQCESGSICKLHSNRSFCYKGSSHWSSYSVTLLTCCWASKCGALLIRHLFCSKLCCSPGRSRDGLSNATWTPPASDLFVRADIPCSCTRLTYVPPELSFIIQTGVR